ncbi:hypothetical protein CABS01_12777 [Colletotrichum abscissum]|uniref:Uncharacterized protein n=1 Tax=Colletotrichum abscissum TaxID=1671311 RepID=A0A9P9X7K3_9PEZI|nr:uncharacterized protein CABS01_12777 [Colletotrichum abscissum]KAI3541032.1 hypothetical protein CABS02_10876 [Colletotrichum abscissum]KAK1487902.1 hypothetical protein CABS01_12777 [Colletotrichum abscissum]
MEASAGWKESAREGTGQAADGTSGLGQKGTERRPIADVISGDAPHLTTAHFNQASSANTSLLPHSPHITCPLPSTEFSG